LTGISAFLQGNEEGAAGPLARTCEQLGPLAGRFALQLQGRQFHLDPKALMRSGNIAARPADMQPADLMALVSEIDLAAMQAPGFWPLEQALEALKPAIKAAAKLPLQEGEWLRACNTWRRIPLLRTTFLGPYAKAALKRFPQQLSLRFFVIEADIAPDRAMALKTRNKLTALLEQAHAAGDQRCATMAAQALTEDDRHRAPGFGPAFGQPLGQPFGSWDDDEPEDSQLNLFDDQPFDPPPLPLPPGVTEEEFLDQMLKAGIPADLQPVFKEISRMTGITDQREILKIVIAQSLDEHSPSTPKRGRRRR